MSSCGLINQNIIKMKRPKIEDFKVEFTKGITEIASARKQYSKAQDLYIDELEQFLIQRVVVNEAEIDEDVVVNVPHKSLGKYSIKKIEDSEVELCECNWPLIRTGTKERPEYCGNCEKDI